MKRLFAFLHPAPNIVPLVEATGIAEATQDHKELIAPGPLGEMCSVFAVNENLCKGFRKGVCVLEGPHYRLRNAFGLSVEVHRRPP